MAVDLETLSPNIREYVIGLQAEVNFLREQLRLRNLRQFGAKAETLPDLQQQLLSQEPGLQQEEATKETPLTAEEIKAIVDAEEVKPGNRQERRKQRGRVELPAHLPRVERIIACTKEQCTCGKCQKEMPVFGYDTAEELDCEPIKLFVRVTKREKRACLSCEDRSVTTAPLPAKIIPKSKLSDGIIIDTVISKYLEHTPLFRQSVRWTREHQVNVSRSTLCDCVMAVGTLLKPVSAQMLGELLAGPLIQADESPVAVQDRKVAGRNHQGYLWEYSIPHGSVVFDFRMGRSREGPGEVLKTYNGVLQCDGFQAYDKIGGARMIFAGCWAHARRGFVNAHKAAGSDPVALAIVAKINGLYRVEREARKEGLAPQMRLKLRQEKSVPQMEEIRRAVAAALEKATPSSYLAKACSYVENQWSRLQVYLSDGVVEIDNNHCENAIRPIALGRKNWLHVGHELAGPNVAAIISVMETCRRLGINPKEYLLDVLPGLSERPVADIKNLTPAAWLAARTTASASQP